MRSIFKLLLLLPFWCEAQSSFTFRIRTDISNSRMDNIVITNNGKYSITCSADKSIKVWDNTSGDFLWEYTAYFGQGRDGAFTAMDLEPINNNLIAAGGMFNSGDLDDTISGRVLLFDFKSRNITRELIGHAGVVAVVKFLKDGKHLISADQTGNVILWNLETGTKKKFSTHDRTEPKIAITSNGFIIASTTSGVINEFKTENFPLSPKSTFQITAAQKDIASIHFIESKKLLILGMFNKQLLIYDSLSRLIQTVYNGTIASGISCNSTESIIACGRSFGNSSLNFYKWKKDSLILKQSLDGFYDLVKGLAFTPENDLLVADNETGCITRINLEKDNFRIVRKLQKTNLAAYSVGVPKGTEKGKIYFSTDHEFMDRGFSRFNHVFDLLNRKISPLNERVLYGTKPITEVGDLSLESGAPEKLSSYSNTLKLVQYGVENPLMEIKTGNVFRCYTLTLDSNLIIAGGREGVLEAFDLKGRKICDLQGHTSDIFCVNESPDQKFIISSSREGLIHFWERKNIGNPYQMKPSISIYFLSSDDWVIWTSEGYFTSTRSGAKMLGLQQNYARNEASRFIPIEVFDFTYNRPDLVFQKLGINNPELIALYWEAALKRLKKSGFKSFPKFSTGNLPSISYVTQNQETTLDSFQVLFKAFDEQGLIKSIRVLNQGVQIKQIKLKKNEKQTFDGSVYIPLVDGRNTIEIIAYTDSGFRSIGEKLIINNVRKKQKTLYVMCVSVSNYKDESMQLNYAVKDGRDLMAKLISSAGSTFDKIISDTLFNVTVNKENIKKIKTKLTQLGTNDAVIIYFSGHGFLDKNKDFYYGTYNIDKLNPEIEGMAFSEIEDLFAGCKALKRLLVIDACHGGEVDKEENEIVENKKTNETGTNNLIAYQPKGIGFMNTKINYGSVTSFDVLQELFSNGNNENGVEVIAASAGNSYAYESDEWKNGVFTYSLIQALTDTATDKNGDGKWSIQEIKKYTSEMVFKLTNGRQKPAMRQEVGSSDWYLK